MSALAAKAKWYVYELFDPRDEQTFYVGKGKGDRISFHEREAQDPSVCSGKTKKINELWSAGCVVGKRKVAMFWVERAAYEFEADRIAEYGLDTLTNIASGGGGSLSKVRRGRGRSSRADAMQPEEYVRDLAKGHRGTYWFAQWLRLQATGKEATLTGSKAGVLLMACMMKTIFPHAWEQIKKSRGALDMLKPLVAEHGVELVYGGP